MRIPTDKVGVVVYPVIQMYGSLLIFTEVKHYLSYVLSFYKLAPGLDITFLDRKEYETKYQIVFIEGQ